MQGQVWYNRVVPKENEKKTVQIGVKLPESLYEIIEEVCRAEDRPVGYVARELMVRGLALYRVDGRLRDDSTSAESKIVATIAPGSIEEARRLYEQNTAAAETRAAFGSKLKIKGEKKTDAEEGTEGDNRRVSTPRKRAGGR